jgi:hypothetical protein
MDSSTGCMQRILRFATFVAFIIGLIYFGGEVLSKLFGNNSPDKESTTTELENIYSETTE